MVADRGALPGFMTEHRRFPPPWTAEETDACFIVKDCDDRALPFRVYYDDEPGRRAAYISLTQICKGAGLVLMGCHRKAPRTLASTARTLLSVLSSP